MAKHTPGPWRWEFSPKHKTAELVGGKPMYDKTVMGFARVGLGHAGPLFIDSEDPDGYSVLHRLIDKAKEWCAPIKDRKHHAHWLQEVIHPDAVLIAAAPELLEALEELVCIVQIHSEATLTNFAWAELSQALALIEKIKGN